MVVGVAGRCDRSPGRESGLSPDEAGCRHNIAPIFQWNSVRGDMLFS